MLRATRLGETSELRHAVCVTGLEREYPEISRNLDRAVFGLLNRTAAQVATALLSLGLSLSLEPSLALTSTLALALPLSLTSTLPLALSFTLALRRRSRVSSAYVPPMTTGRMRWARCVSRRWAFRAGLTATLPTCCSRSGSRAAAMEAPPVWDSARAHSCRSLASGHMP